MSTQCCILGPCLGRSRIIAVPHPLRRFPSASKISVSLLEANADSTANTLGGGGAGPDSTIEVMRFLLCAIASDSPRLMLHEQVEVNWSASLGKQHAILQAQVLCRLSD